MVRISQFSYHLCSSVCSKNDALTELALVLSNVNDLTVVDSQSQVGVEHVYIYFQRYSSSPVGTRTALAGQWRQSSRKPGLLNYKLEGHVSKHLTVSHITRKSSVVHQLNMCCKVLAHHSMGTGAKHSAAHRLVFWKLKLQTLRQETGVAFSK